jgi:hypothetical protein
MRNKDESWSLSYSATDKDTRNDVKSVSVSWQERSAEETLENINTFLTAAGVPLRVVRAE